MSADAPHRTEKVPHLGEAPGLEDGAVRRRGAQDRGEQRDVCRGHPPCLAREHDQLGDLVETAVGHGAVRRRREPAHGPLSGGGASERSDRLEHAGELERLEVAGPQGSDPTRTARA